MTGNDRPGPPARATSVTLAAMSASRMPGRAMRMPARCMSIVGSTAPSISASSSLDFTARCSTTARTNGTLASGTLRRSSRPITRSMFSARYGGSVWTRRPLALAPAMRSTRAPAGAVVSTPARAANSAVEGCGPIQTMASMPRSSAKTVVLPSSRSIDGCEAGTIDAEVVEERAVLPVRIGVVGVVAGTLVVAQEQQQAVFALPGQGVLEHPSSIAVRCWCEHGASRRGSYVVGDAIVHGPRPIVE